MGRTQELYNRDGSLIPPSPLNGTYDFPEWSDWRLEQRMADVLESSQIPHSDERQANLTREMAHIAFELTWRTTHEL